MNTRIKDYLENKEFSLAKQKKTGKKPEQS